MFKIAICDDDRAVCDEIKNYLLEYKTQHYVKFDIEIFNNGEELLSYAKTKNDYDLIFLDIELPDISGDKISEKLREISKDILIIFVTSHDEMVYSIIKNTPFRFIRKSHLDKEINEAINSVFQKLDSRDTQIKLRNKGGIIYQKFKEVVFFETYGHELTCHTTNGKYSINHTLKDIVNDFSDIGIVQVHKSFAVNIHYVFSINKSDIVLANNLGTIPLSKHKIKEVKEKLLFFLR